MASESTRGHATWIVNFGASHHITFDFQNLFPHLEYGANEDIMIGDGKGIPLTHVGSTTLNYPITNFSLNNDLTTRASLAQGQNKGHVYEWPTSTSPSLAKPLALLSTTFTMDS
ncbi:Retrovirus-related Pol polyprotein from transposon RE1 [Vitis vinifera]|uniref:Retrovirus-related Pol polyprotein from transposon RE1 n=1 Tax=Vitis vinifera TaxID=29760 RepID=A0A438BR27_VITVI|nr:Retrovirus-related Pol polyprotein from transposon RE1 [Vitis vinifera]